MRGYNQEQGGVGGSVWKNAGILLNEKEENLRKTRKKHLN